jgi:hypothetical protein
MPEIQTPALSPVYAVLDDASVGARQQEGPDGSALEVKSDRTFWFVGMQERLAQIATSLAALQVLP